jgi:hypothetical protein
MFNETALFTTVALIVGRAGAEELGDVGDPPQLSSNDATLIDARA